MFSIFWSTQCVKTGIRGKFPILSQIVPVPKLNFSYQLNVHMIRMGNHCQPVRIIPRVWFSMPNWILKPGRLIVSEVDTRHMLTWCAWGGWWGRWRGCLWPKIRPCRLAGQNQMGRTDPSSQGATSLQTSQETVEACKRWTQKGLQDNSIFETQLCLVIEKKLFLPQRWKSELFLKANQTPELIRKLPIFRVLETRKGENQSKLSPS